MEMKSIKPMKLSPQWIKQNCMAYKRWFIFTTVMLSVITIVVPMLFEHDPIYFIIPGVSALFLISFVMMLSQLNFLHESKAFAYVASKALPLKSRIYGIVITQALFCGAFLIFLYGVGYFSGTALINHGRFGIPELNLLFTTVSAWVLILLLLVPLSALLSGTTISAAVSTLFNFSIPVSIFGVIYFVINVANKGTVGLNVHDIMGELILRFYRIDYIYHVNAPWYAMAILLPLTLGVLFYLLNWAIKNRKHERIGQSFVFKGYKVFILFLLSLLAPLGLTLLLSEASFSAQWVSVLILGSITLYILLAILDKNLKLSRKAYQLIGAYLVGVSLCIGIATLGLNFYIGQIPDLSKVDAVILCNDSWVRDHKGNYHSIYDLGALTKTGDLPIYRSEGMKKQVHLLHQLIIEEPQALNFYKGAIGWQSDMNFNLVYLMNDGSRRIFPFKIPYELSHGPDKDSVYKVWAGEMLKQEEFLASASPLLFGKEDERTLSAEVYLPEGAIQIDQSQLKTLVDLVRKEINLTEDSGWFWYLFTSSDGFIDQSHKEDFVYKYNVSLKTNNGYYFDFMVYEHQKELIDYLESLMKK